VTVQFAFFFNLDNDPGCDPDSTSSVYSPGVAALANVSGHDLSRRARRTRAVATPTIGRVPQVFISSIQRG
jgi:hypothetical protein